MSKFAIILRARQVDIQTNIEPPPHMTDTFIELNRRFNEFRPDESAEDVARRSYIAGFHSQQHGVGWDELLKHKLVVVLGEPGSGKTRELLAKHRSLSSPSFFLRLDQLVDTDLTNLLSHEETQRFEDWQQSDTEATFFLDAVDESKIRGDGDFLKALDRVNKSLGKNVSRSRFVISSRISEWRPQTDREAVLHRLGIETKLHRHREDAEHASDDHISQREVPEEADRSIGNDSHQAIFVATLLPLTPPQVRVYAQARGVPNPQDFISALEDNNAWAFAGRPLDVQHLYAYWVEKGHFSNLTDLTEYMVSRLLDELQSKEKLDPLTKEKVRSGAEYLAAATLFCRRLKIRVSDDDELTKEPLLSPRVVLPDSWRPAERRALLNRALFDAATHGCIAFHHRSHAEYLAAKWLDGLMANNCPLTTLEDLLFSEVSGKRILRPSLAPVAAWLANSGTEPWRIRLMEALLETAPEIHLVHGDPALLPIPYRRRLLENLVDRYKGRSLVWLQWDHAALARLASTDLIDDINRYLLDKTIAEDLRADILMIVREGKLKGCVPTALTLFDDPSSTDSLRSYVASVVRDVGASEHRQRLFELCLTREKIPHTLFARVLEAIFYDEISAEPLIQLLVRCDDISQFEVDVPYVLRSLLEEKLSAENANAVLSEVLRLIKTPPLRDRSNLSQRFLWLACAIPACIQKIFSVVELDHKVFTTAIEATFVLEKLERHGEGHIPCLEKEEIGKAAKAMAENDTLRRNLFWARVEKYRQRLGKEPKPYEIGTFGALVEAIPTDCDWLFQDAKSKSAMPDRILAIEVAARLLWSAKVPLISSARRLRNCARGQPALLAICKRNLMDRLKAPFIRFWMLNVKNKFLQTWWWDNWRYRSKNGLQNMQYRIWLWCHLGGLRKGLYPYVLANFVRLVTEKDHSQYSGSNWNAVAENWGTFISSAVRDGCIARWRQYAPPLPHEKQDRNSLSGLVPIGLVALQTLWRRNKENILNLPAGDVHLAVRYACNELNGLPEWFFPLLQARPSEVGKVLDIAVAGEWKLPSDIEHVTDVVAKLAWAPTPAEQVALLFYGHLQSADPTHPKVLEYALSNILQSGGTALDSLKSLAPTKVSMYALGEPQWLIWASVWLQVDASNALDYLEKVISSAPPEQADSLVLQLCSVMSGKYGERLRTKEPSYLKSTSLARLLLLVVCHVRSAEDTDRAGKGVYSPNSRDNAQGFRSHLWEMLGRSQDKEADAAFDTLRQHPALAAERDWLTHLIEQRRSRLADDTPMNQEDIPLFSQNHSKPPRSDYQFFRLISRLLVEIKNHVEVSDNSTNRLQVRDDDREKSLQGFLTRELGARSLKWFSITQEDEIDLEERVDIRAERPGLNALPIEVKLANLSHWSLAALLERLENQLIGQYLRSANTCFGIYVLGNTSPTRKWELPETGEQVQFAEMVKYVQSKAAEIVAQLRPGVDGLQVIGIDFSDPRERS